MSQRQHVTPRIARMFRALEGPDDAENRGSGVAKTATDLGGCSRKPVTKSWPKASAAGVMAVLRGRRVRLI